MKRTTLGPQIKRDSDIYCESDDSDLINWAFDPFLVDQQVLYFNFARMLELTGITNRFDLKQEVVLNFAKNIANKYQTNTYHNFQHGFSTAHFCFISIYRCHDIEKCLRSIDVFALLIAALMHDVDHPGTNNNYEIQKKTELAIRYNDTSVLEAHHAAVGWDIIYNQSGNNTIVDQLSIEDLNTFRKTTIRAILHTDMVHHFSLIDQLSGLSPNAPFDVNKPSGKFKIFFLFLLFLLFFFVSHPLTRSIFFNYLIKIIYIYIFIFLIMLSDRITLVGTLIHAADISNPLIPDFNLVAKWAEKISHEFVNQYRSEVELGLKPTNMWSSLDTNFTLGMYDSQVKFIQFIVQPMWTIILDLFPEFNSEGNLLVALNKNKAQWKSLLKEEKSRVEVEEQ